MPEPSLIPTRDAIVAHARLWIGTPYHDQASTCGAGTDCLGLIRGIYRALYGHDVAAVPAYTRDWAEAAGEEAMLAAARRHLVEIPVHDIAPGDVLVFRYHRHHVAKHAAIFAGKTMVHAVEGAPVSEVPFSSWWHRRMAGAFAFPGVIV
jgi:NlpC/P60 family putative phage cell wall peptidase